MTKKRSARQASGDERSIRREDNPVKSKRSKIFSIVSVIVIVAGAAVGARLLLGGGGPADVPLSSASTSVAATEGHLPYPLVEADESGTVRLSVETFDDYAAHYYTYMHNDQPIEFFILKSEDGVVRAAFNACDVCYSSLKGYSQDGQIMICNNCGSQFPADQINVVRGGCNPSPLDRIVEDNYLVINEDDIIRGAGYF